MLNLLKALRQDEHGVILSAEIVIIGSLLVVGLITGLTCLQQSVNGELKDLAGALGALDQSYSYSAHRKQGFGDQCCAWTAGSSYTNCENKTDKCTDIVGCTDMCVQGTSGCCQDSNCVGRPEGIGACGTCGGRSGGCGTCGGGRAAGGFSSDGYLPPRKARCIESGVPKMKVSEWPLDYPTEVIVPSSSVPHQVIESSPPALCVPVGEQIIHEHPPVARPQSHVQGGAVIEHHQVIEHANSGESTPVQPSAPAQQQVSPPAQPVPSNDPLPMPNAEQPKVPSSTT